jgi:hypothetical protein
MDGADVGMIQGRGGARFQLETLQRLLVLCQIFRKKLQRDAPPELEIFRDLADEVTPLTIGL